MRYLAGLLALGLLAGQINAQVPRAFPDGKPQDRRSGDLRDLNGYFPFKSVETLDLWKTRQAEIRRRILVSQGLWPLPTRTPIDAVVHGRVERDDYVVDRVYFESAPGHFVTGSLYRPNGKSGPFPAILSPHGHWKDGRFYDAGEKAVADQIESGGEVYEVGGRYPIQARAVQLARMGCLVFVYDMTGNADSIQIGHRPVESGHLDKTENWGFMSVQADLRLQNMMGLQTWNSIRTIDFLLALEDTDPDRIGVTGASGGGTQSMIIAAIDERIDAAMPCVMVSTAMQGGCTCENAPLLRIDQGNIDIAAATAPRPLGLTAADDWTIELETKGYPDLVQLYEMLGAEDHLTAVFHTQFKHNYNYVNRAAMYSFFNKHFGLGLEEPVVEPDFVPLSREEATVWDNDHPAPSGDQVGDPHEIKLLKMATEDSFAQLQKLVPNSPDDLEMYQVVVGGAWETILGRRLDQIGKVTFTQTGSAGLDGTTVHIGHVDHVDQGEQIPVMKIEPAETIGGTVIWITETGKASVIENEHLSKPLKQLVDAGLRVVAADLFGQGEFVDEASPSTSQRMWYQRGGDQSWHRFSGYTYGYNHCLFAQRVHDILSLVKEAKMSGEAVHLVGLDKVAGPLVVAARTQAGDAVERVWADLGDFRFAELTRHDDPMFVPGAVKYLDVDGLLSLCAPGIVTVFNRKDDFPISKQLYRAAGATQHLMMDGASVPASVVVQKIVGNR